MPEPSRKTALVTGGAKRIGRAIALTLAQKGWDIALHYRSSAGDAETTAREIESLGRRVCLLQADLADEGQVRPMLARATEALGPVGCVVNNASLFEPDAANDFSPALLDRHMRINVAAPLLLAQTLHAATPEGAQSVVINLLDQKLFNLNRDFLSYTLSKAALQTATTMLAQALAPRVRVVGVAPGLTMPSHLQSEDDFAATHVLSPLGESSRPEEVASAVAFAAENRGITGSTIIVDAGQHLLPFPRDFSFMKRN